MMAQSILVVPLIAALTRRLVLDGLRDGGDQLRSMGAGPLTTALLMLLHERLGAVTILLDRVRSRGLRSRRRDGRGRQHLGVTRVMTTAIALETAKGDLPLALALGIVLLGVVGLVNLLIGWLQPRGAVVREVWA